MTVFYKKAQRINPVNKKGPRQWFPVIKSIGQTTENEVAQKIADEVTLNPKEAEMTLYQLEKVLVNDLLDGKTVKLGELGTFYLSAKCEPAESEEQVSARQIKQVSLNFCPSEKLRDKLNKAAFRPIENLINKQK